MSRIDLDLSQSHSLVHDSVSTFLGDASGAAELGHHVLARSTTQSLRDAKSVERLERPVSYLVDCLEGIEH